jgi:Zn-dependent protease with chaperone function
MFDSTLSYPPMPDNVDASIIKPSKRFNKQVITMLGAIALFFVTYFILFLISLAIAACFFGIAYFLVVVVHLNWLTIALAIALVASGILLIYFLIKFLFKKSDPIDNSDLIEVTAQQHPKLFAFITKLTNETQVDFPKHVYLTQEVNASVYFDSGFWSMFLPVKKNLKIGLGLINALNQSEFKAVMAHEFGHFSQRSMRFGSYVYNLNKVIYNLLYDNESYEALIDSWSNSYSVFRITGLINTALIRGMQYTLKKVHVLINKTHMGLSREMEFQADAIAAYVSGSNQFISSLRKLEMAQTCYDELLDYWNGKLKSNQRAKNIYEQHQEVMRNFAKTHHLSLDTAGLPIVDKHLAVLFNSQVSINDQWSSHPTIYERGCYLDELNIITNTVDEPAWLLFTNPEQIQVEATHQLYAQFKDNNLELIDGKEFKEMYDADIRAHSYDPYFKGYYDSRKVNVSNLTPTVSATNVTAVAIHNLFNSENCNLPRHINGMQQDIDLLNFAATNTDIKTFDYKGIKYYNKSAADVSATIALELTKEEQKLRELDQHIYNLFYGLANDEGKLELKTGYQTLIDFQETAEQATALYGKLMAEMSPVYGTMQFADINDTLAKVYQTEKQLKAQLTQMLNTNEYSGCISPEQLTTVEKYLAEDWKYFDGQVYNNDNLAIFNNAADTYILIINKKQYTLKNDLLNFKLSLLN